MINELFFTVVSRLQNLLSGSVAKLGASLAVCTKIVSLRFDFLMAFRIGSKTQETLDRFLDV